LFYSKYVHLYTRAFLSLPLPLSPCLLMLLEIQ
jgi:hypothetical protein